MRSAATKAIAMGRLGRQESAPRLPETVFDSPLQQAMNLLAQLTESLEEAGDDEAAAAAMHVSHLLRSKHLHASSIIDEIELGGVAAGDDVHGWLSSMGRPAGTRVTTRRGITPPRGSSTRASS